MPVHKKVAKIAKKIGKIALKRVGIKFTPKKKKLSFAKQRIRNKRIAAQKILKRRNELPGGKQRAADRLPGPIGVARPKLHAKPRSNRRGRKPLSSRRRRRLG